MRKISWLASYPKSGNTWVRCLIGAYITGSCNPNHLPGCVTQSDLKTYHHQVVSPHKLSDLPSISVLGLRSAVLEHLRMGPWGLVKTHNARMKVMDISLIPHRVTERAIYLVRDPRDVLASFASHNNMPLDDIIELSAEPNAVLKKVEEPNLCHLLSSWSRHVDSWMRSPFPVLCLKYETLRERPHEQLGKIMEFIGVDPDEDRVAVAVEATRLETLQSWEKEEGFREAKNGQFFGGERSALTTEQRERIEHLHADVMQAMGYL